MEKDRILLFIPMYNCEKQITRVLNQLNQKICSFITEAIIINNCSTDNGEGVVVDYLKSNNMDVRVTLLRNRKNYGLGGSHKVAFDYAKKHGFDYIIVLHGDAQGDIDNILEYLESGEYKNWDCFLGARFKRGAKLEGYSAFRTIGNLVYNFLFTIGTGKKIYDLGSGLNMYRVKILESYFYKRYKDNLMFNYCMILGHAYFQHKIYFFPITWKEDGQISNVKMFNQAITVLGLLGEYILNKKRFIYGEHRDEIIRNYRAEEIYWNKVKQ